jgi:uncharacterized protein HemX
MENTTEQQEVKTVATVGTPDMPADLQKVLPQGQTGWVTVVLAAIAVLGSGAGWKFWKHRENMKLEEKKLEHEQKMKELELKAELAKAQAEAERKQAEEEKRKADEEKEAKKKQAADKLKKKVSSIKSKR